MTWRRLSAQSITDERGYEIHRRERPDGSSQYVVWGPPGSFAEVYGADIQGNVKRELEAMGFVPGNVLGAGYAQARACLGGYESADEARTACE